MEEPIPPGDVAAHSLIDASRQSEADAMDLHNKGIDAIDDGGDDKDAADLGELEVEDLMTVDAEGGLF